jgi:nitrous oxidase accessory protein
VAGDVALDEARRGNGIHLYSSKHAHVRGNTVRDTRDGIYVSFTSESAVEDNDIERVRYGLHYMYSDDNRFVRNRFTRSAAGAAIMFSKRISLDDNVFSDNVGYRAYGILLQTTERIEVTGNDIVGNLVGIFLENATRNELRANRIVGNGVGIDLVASAEDNTFTENVIVDNRTAVRVSAGGGVNAFAAGGRGNYWGVRAALDLDGDGLGDRPWRAIDAFGSLAATRPVLEVFATTPAARVLSWVERTFPVFDVPHVEDPYPLAEPPRAGGAPPQGAEGSAAPALLVVALLLALGSLVVRCRYLFRTAS